MNTKQKYIVVTLASIMAFVSTLHAATVAVEDDPDAPRDDWPVLQAAASALDQARIVVSPNAHVGASMAEFQYHECVLAADPRNPERLVAAVMHWRGTDVDIATFYSHDAGKKWDIGCQGLGMPGQRLADPTVSFGPDGTVYLVHMRTDPSKTKTLGAEGEGSIDFLASTDGGKTWETRSTVTQYIDRPWIAVDTTTGKNSGQLYCIGNIDEPVFLISSDGAKSLARSLRPLKGNKLVNCRPANPVVLADGKVLLVCEDRLKVSPGTRLVKRGIRPQLLAWVSRDGGQTVNDVTPVNTKWWHDTIKSSRNSITAAEFPQLAADPGSQRFANRAYCVWMDGNDHNAMRIFFSGSPDGGATWTQPIVLSEQPMQAGAEGEYATFMPSVAVNRDGVVAVSWYDRRGLPKSKLVPIEFKDGKPSLYRLATEGWNVRARASLDGGATWLPSVQVNEQPSQGKINVGHTAGLAAAADGRFHAAWINNHTGKHQLWTAAIHVMKGLKSSSADE